MKNKIILFLILSTAANLSARQADRLIKVDEQGVMRWQDDNGEVALFGVNYCLPSASAYRMAARVGASYKQTIDQDVAHFARMGLDGIRLSFWGDWECADANGNLIDNEHLRLLDYLIYKAKERGIYMLLSPIILYDSRWPDAMGSPIDGFSKVYGKVRDSKIGTDPNGIKIQANYLSQIMRHVNRYTKLAYKDDPAILAVELVNEPYLPPGVTEYINTLAKAICDTPCNKPIFFNVSQDMRIAAAIRDSMADGATFGWYPTELLAGWSLRGNFLPYVDDYPLMRDPALATKAKIVYEFDAADVSNSYMYPAMARTFRSGGAQFAAMFTYDPLTIASTNIEFQTHYLNLVYTPNKAVSFIIAAQAFHNLPRLKSYGKYPQDTVFGPFRVDYDKDLSEMVSDSAFMYSNDTQTMPPKPNMLTRIVGCGCSPVVSYEGTGSYFLDKLENGLWRLEVYPDAVWVDDPYGIHRLDREVSRVLWRNWPMEINLPDLGQTFTVEPIDKGNNFNTEMTNGAFMIYPGVYLLRREDANSSTWRASTPFGHLLLGEFVAPPELHKVPIIVHKPPYQIVAGRDWLVTAQVVSSTFPKAVALYMRRAGEKQFNRYNMNRCKGYEYNTKIPGDSLERGLIEYSLSIEYDQTVQSFPAKVAARPGDWDFPETTLWHALVVNHDAPIVLFDAERDRHKVLFPHPWGTAPYNKAFVPGVRGSNLALRVDITQLASDTEEFVWRSTFVTEIESRHIDINYCNTLSITARAGTEATTQFSIALIDKDGTGWGTSIPVATHWQEIRIPLSILQPTKVAVLPRGWPRFSKWLEGTTNASSRLTLSDIEGLQISLTSKFPRGMKSLPHALEIQSVMLERVPEGKRSDIKTVLTIP